MATKKELLDYRGKPRVQTVNDQPSKTIQSDAHLADIQKILGQFGHTGILDSLQDADDVYMDVSEFTDFTTMHAQAEEAKARFMELPSKVREVFNHDVFEWLDAAHDPEKAARANSELAAKGLIPTPEEEVPAAAPPADAPSTP